MDNNNNNSENVVISKKSLIPIETLITVVVMAIAITGTWIRSDMRTNVNAESIVELKGGIKTLTESVETSLTDIDDTLDQMLLESKIKNKLDEYRIREWWTSDMMSEYTDILETILTDGGINISKMPNVSHIKKRIGPNL